MPNTGNSCVLESTASTDIVYEPLAYPLADIVVDLSETFANNLTHFPLDVGHFCLKSAIEFVDAQSCLKRPANKVNCQIEGNCI